MNFKHLQVVSSDNSFGAISYSSDETFFLACIETPQISSPIDPSTYLKEAALKMDCDFNSKTWSLNYAIQLDKVLQNLKLVAVYNSVSISQEGIHVCNAGNLRAHIVKDSLAIKCTRDHTMRYANDDELFPEMRELKESHGNAVIRALGGDGGVPEESRWNSAPPYSVVVCSSSIHHGETIDKYPYGMLHPINKEKILASYGFVASVDAV